MANEVLELLLHADGFLSGQAISNQLGVSRAAVWKKVKALQEAGYEIDSVTNRGYRLRACPDVLTQEQLRAALGPHPWADQIVLRETVDSTNNLAKQLGADGAPSGTVVMANEQTGGRGRLGRSFSSKAGTGLYFSLLLRPDAAPDRLAALTACVAVATCDAILEVCGVRPGIKWTNDLVLNGRKLSGILTELSLEAEAGTVSYVVIGIGINVNQKLEDFPPEVQPVATSLLMATGQKVQRAALAAALIRSLSRMAETYLTEKAVWIDRYRADCLTIGREVQILRGEHAEPAHCDGVDEDAALLVSYPDGRRERIFSGEVSVRALYGYV